MLGQQVQGADRQPKLAGVRQLADALAQVDQLVAGDLCDGRGVCGKE